MEKENAAFHPEARIVRVLWPFNARRDRGSHSFSLPYLLHAFSSPLAPDVLFLALRRRLRRLCSSAAAPPPLLLHCAASAPPPCRPRSSSTAPPAAPLPERAVSRSTLRPSPPPGNTSPPLPASTQVPGCRRGSCQMARFPSVGAVFGRAAWFQGVAGCGVAEPDLDGADATSRGRRRVGSRRHGTCCCWRGVCSSGGRHMQQAVGGGRRLKQRQPDMQQRRQVWSCFIPRAQVLLSAPRVASFGERMCCFSAPVVAAKRGRRTSPENFLLRCYISIIFC